MGNKNNGQCDGENIDPQEAVVVRNTPKHFQIKSNYAVLKNSHDKRTATNKIIISGEEKPLKQISGLEKETSIGKVIENQISLDSAVMSVDHVEEEADISNSQDSTAQRTPKLRSFKTINLSEFIQFKTSRVTDSYTFHGRIDGGTFGDVYKASSKANTGSLRAIKAISEANASQGVMKEINMLKALDHPNVLKIYEVYRYSKMVYIVTEFLPGGNLMQLASKKQKYSEYYIAGVMKEIISGLVYLHSNGIIHRDLKPQNIMFQSKPNSGHGDQGNDQAPHAKIIDFGVSIYRESGKPVSGMVGTPYFIAPEVLVGCYDEKCDIWSCGVMLYFMLCGSLPYKGGTSNDIVNRILYHKVTFKEKEWSMISKSAIALLRNMLNKNKSERYSAKEVLQSEWMKNRKTEMINFQEDALENLRTHGFKDNFTAIVKTYIASMTTSLTERRLMAEKFMELDQDQSGFIDRQELKLGFEREGIPCPNIDDILAKVDTNKSGKIDFTEFITAMSNQESLFAKEKLGMAFQYLDSDHTGFIEVSQIMQVLKGSSEEEVADILAVFDKDRDNKISKDEFIGTMIEYAETGQSALDTHRRKKAKVKINSDKGNGNIKKGKGSGSEKQNETNMQKIRKGTLDYPIQVDVQTKVEESQKKRFSENK